jgi:acetolactate synthase-1/2/3 large subunit
LNNSEIIFASLHEAGINYCTCVSGGGIMYLVDAVGRNSDISKRHFHHEQSAAFACEAYTRATANPSICLITIGPGVANAISGAFSCFINSVPVIFISGAKRSHIKTNYSMERFNFPQDADTESIVSPVVKKYYKIEESTHICSLINQAVNCAVSGRPGPVWIDVPLDLQAKVQLSSHSRVVLKKTEKSFEFDTFSKFISKKKKPIFIFGRGLESVLNRVDFLSFRKNIKLPIITSIGSNHLISENKNFSAGFFGPTGRRAANILLENSDSIIAVGSGLDIDNTGFNREAFFKNKSIYLINSDENLSKTIPLDKENIDFQILDIKNIDFNILLSVLDEKNDLFTSWAEFSNEINLYFSVEKELSVKENSLGIDPYLFGHYINKILPKNSAVVGGISLDVHSFSHVAFFKENQKFYLSPHCGQLGWDLPALVGICDSELFESHICITGDGSFMFNLQELATLSIINKNITIFIYDNNGYNSIRTTQDTYFEKRYFGSSKKDIFFPNWSLLAKSFNFKYYEISNEKGLNNIHNILTDFSRKIVVVKIDENSSRLPRLISEIKNGKFISPKLSEQYPYLSKNDEEFIAQLKNDKLKNI